jgi:hypothetical protein
MEWVTAVFPRNAGGATRVRKLADAQGAAPVLMVQLAIDRDRQP